MIYTLPFSFSIQNKNSGILDKSMQSYSRKILHHMDINSPLITYLGLYHRISKNYISNMLNITQNTLKYISEYKSTLTQSINFIDALFAFTT